MVKSTVQISGEKCALTLDLTTDGGDTADQLGMLPAKIILPK